MNTIRVVVTETVSVQRVRTYECQGVQSEVEEAAEQGNLSAEFCISESDDLDEATATITSISSTDITQEKLDLERKELEIAEQEARLA
ncbi:hypothetical protein J4N45_10985 [Vibrio sp. SCSIO 43140]|uniref:hypothetical protein n=1 Tax=Vibrio sp. SCSIO 43140 TaxID=2819100 RepID=UPI002075CCB4|nr:hypothetical protein [Vibrio sp. SCSIO 43140]USD59055.1 hypothetical protein J4N45_10985 [Vibrio sp. SCSIO 43140]